jgi:hypothetical protein
VQEQSQKEEMRAALRGDFERLHARRGDVGLVTASAGPEAVEPVRSAPPPAPETVTVVEPDDSGLPGPASWLDRLLRRP